VLFYRVFATLIQSFFPFSSSCIPPFYSYYLLVVCPFFLILLSSLHILVFHFFIFFFFSYLVRKFPGPFSNYANLIFCLAQSFSFISTFSLCVCIYFIISILFIESHCCLYVIGSSYKDLSSSLDVSQCHYSPQT